MPAAFASAALDLPTSVWPIPLGGEDGKRPLVHGFTHWHRRPSTGTLVGWARQFPDANLGVLCAQSQLAMLDVDARDPPTVLNPIIAAARILVRSPRGWHAYFSSRKLEVSSRSLLVDGVQVDLKATSALVVAPPSTRFSDGAPYAFERGGWETVDELERFPIELFAAETLRWGNHPKHTRVAIGGRNDALFRTLLRHAPSCDNFEALMDVAETANDNYLEVPLSPSELHKIATSAWGYEISGENWAGRGWRIVIAEEDIAALAHSMHGGDGLVLLSYLRRYHGPEAQFAIAPEAMARSGVVPQWTAWRFRMARDALREAGLIERVKLASSEAGQWRKWLYRWPRIKP